MVPSNKSVRSARPMITIEARNLPLTIRVKEPITTMRVPIKVMKSAEMPSRSKPLQSGVMTRTTDGFMRALIMCSS